MSRTPIFVALLLLSFVVGASSAVAACARCPNASFAPAIRTLGEDLGPVGNVIVTDLSGDGIQDLAVRTNPGVTAYLGAGGGSFGPPLQTLVPKIDQNVAIGVGDFNEDGRPDLVVGIHGSGVAILLGGGNGMFFATAPTGGSEVVLGVSVGDVDKDGHLDVATIAVDGLVRLCRGDGHGGLALVGTFPTGLEFYPYAGAIASGDLDGDGHADVAVTAGYGGLAILRGTAAGFGPPVRLDSEFHPGVTIGDVTGDGKPDIITTTLYLGNTVVYPGDGQGAFGSPVRLVLGSNPSAFVVSDLNGDGKPDLAAISYSPPELVTRLGDGAGGFGPSSLFVLGNGPHALTVEDLNGDAIPDFVMAVYSSLDIGLGDGAGGAAVRVLTLGSRPAEVVLADFDGDGVLDIATARADPPWAISTLRGLGGGSFGAESIYAVGDLPFALTVADLRSSGRKDLVMLSDRTMSLETLLNDGSGHFVAGTKRTLTVSGCQSLIMADLNEDGLPDALLACDTSIQVLLGNGAGGFVAPSSIGANARWIAAGDLNGDGHLDLVALRPASTRAEVYFGDGHGNLSGPILTDLPHLQAGGLVLTDLDGDGRLDIVTAAFADGKDVLDVMFGDGTGRFGRPRSFSSIVSATPVAAADLDGDGRPDLITSHGYGPAVMMNDGSGNLLEPRTYDAGVLNSVAAGDLNGDGRADLLIASAGSSLSLLLNTGCTSRHLASVPVFPTCTGPTSSVAPPPVVRVLDDGDSLVTCASGTVTISLAGGTPGAVLSGTTTVPVTAGVATFSNVAINLPGIYPVVFSHSGSAGETRGEIRIGIGVSPALTGPPLVCGQDPSVYDAGAGFDSYVWTVDGAPTGFQRTFTAPFLGPGPHTLSVDASLGACRGAMSTSISNSPPTAISIAPSSGSRGGFTPVTVSGACIASGASLAIGGFLAHSVSAPSSTMILGQTHQHVPGTVDVVVTNPDGQAATLSSAYTYLDGTSAYTLPPCRVFDTRLPNGPHGGPVLRPHVYRSFPVAGTCGVPFGAVAIVVNVTVTQPTSAGEVWVGSGNLGVVSFSAGQTRANNAIVNLLYDESGSVYVYDNSPGTAHVILDVSGYFY